MRSYDEEEAVSILSLIVFSGKLVVFVFGVCVYSMFRSIVFNLKGRKSDPCFPD